MAGNKSKGRVWLAGVGALGVAALVGCVALRASRQAPIERAPVDEAPGTAELEEKLAKLERRLQEVQVNVARVGLEPRTATIETAEQPPTAAPPANTIPAQEHDQMIVAATLDRMESEMKQRPADRGWEQQSRVALTDLLAKPELAGSATVAELSCTSTLCKSVLSHGSPAMREKFMTEHALLQAPFNTNYFFHYAEETNQTVVYFSRRGEALPQADLSGIPAPRPPEP
jgi:hypothetical protein